MSEAKEQKKSKREPYQNEALNSAIKKQELNTAKGIILSLPSIKTQEGKYSIQNLQNNSEILIAALKFALIECADDHSKNLARWEIAWHILHSLIVLSSLKTAKIAIESFADPEEISQNYSHLAYERAPFKISDKKDQLRFLKSLGESTFIAYGGALGKDTQNELSFLIQKFRGIGWGRSLILPEDSKKALKVFKKCLEDFAPDIKEAINKIPEKILNPLLSQLVTAFRAGEADDNKRLSDGQKVEEGLRESTFFEKNVVHLTCEYVGFFGHRSAKEREKKAEPSLLDSAADFVSSVKSFFCGS